MPPAQPDHHHDAEREPQAGGGLTLVEPRYAIDGDTHADVEGSDGEVPTLQGALPDPDAVRGALNPARPSSIEIALECARIADGLKSGDPKLLSVGHHTVIAEYFLVLTGFNKRQIQTIAWGIDKAMKVRGVTKLGLEGYDLGWWVLIDYGDVVVHIFHEDARSYYELDLHWGDAIELPVDKPADEVAAIEREELAAMLVKEEREAMSDGVGVDPDSASDDDDDSDDAADADADAGDADAGDADAGDGDAALRDGVPDSDAESDRL